MMNRTTARKTESIASPFSNILHHSAPGSLRKPNEDAYSYHSDARKGTFVAAIFDGATDISGRDYKAEGKKSPPAFYAENAATVAIEELQNSDDLVTVAKNIIEKMDSICRCEGYVYPGLPRHGLPTAAGLLAHISVPEKTAKFFMLADPSVLIRRKGTDDIQLDGSLNVSHLTRKFHQEAGRTTPDLVSAWHKTATNSHQLKLEAHQFVRDHGLNLPNGYNVFSIHPDAAEKGEYKIINLEKGTTRIYLCSDGIMRPVNDYKGKNQSSLWTTEKLLDTIDVQGPEGAIAAIREIEKAQDFSMSVKKGDDATVLCVDVTI